MSTPRGELYRQLHGLFETYALLTTQLTQLKGPEQAELLLELLELRQQTISRIETLKQSPLLANEAAPNLEKDPEVRHFRQAIRALLWNAQTLEHGLAEKLAAWRDQLQVEARQASLSQRKVQGYTKSRTDHGHYVEQLK